MSGHTNFSSGQELAGYRIESVLGHGGMGVVYRAYDLRLKRAVALKLMAPDLALDERYRERFSRESELAMSLEHPNVVPIHDAGEVEGHLYLAMRQVEGTDLRSLLRKEGALAPHRALAITRQVANALDAAHAKGLVHRDVKPSNVLLDEGEHVYLADFGLTRRLVEQDVQTGDARSLGTPAYLAPEQIEGGPVDGRADVYSLGCLLYECLTGEPPFPRGSRLAVVWAHLEEEPPSASERNPALPEAVDAVIATALSKEPEGRYQTCEQLIGAARDALGLGGPTARRRPVLVAVAALLVGFAALVGAILLIRADSEAAGSTAVVRENTVVRVDPATNDIEAVIGVGREPVAAAVSGGTVWAYSLSGSVAEIDARTNHVRHTTEISSVALDTGPLAGPVLAADGEGAWLVGFDAKLGALLTRVLPGGGGKREYRLRATPSAVAVGEGAIWVLVNDGRGNTLLRVHPRTGVVVRRIPVDKSSYAGGLAISSGAVWAMDSENAVLYRVDPRTGAVRRVRDLGVLATPPVIGFGSLWVCAVNPGSSMLRLDPRTGRTTFAIHSIPAEDGRFAIGHGSLWRHDVPGGTVIRFNPSTGRPAATIRLGPEPPDAGGPAPTGIAAGADAVWVTVGAPRPARS